jgi:anti-sigma factor RsiW
MMGCDTWREDISAWIDGELTPQRRRDLTLHLQGCDSCGRALRAFEQVTAVMRAARPPGVSPRVTDAAMALVRSHGRDGRARLSTRVRQTLFEPFWPKFSLAFASVAVASLLVIVIGRLDLPGNPVGPRTTDSQPQFATAPNPFGGPAATLSSQTSTSKISGELVVANSAAGIERVATLARSLGGDVRSITTTGQAVVVATVPPMAQDKFIAGLSGLGTWQNAPALSAFGRPITVEVRVTQHP